MVTASSHGLETTFLRINILFGPRKSMHCQVASRRSDAIFDSKIDVLVSKAVAQDNKFVVLIRISKTITKTADQSFINTLRRQKSVADGNMLI